MPTLRWYQDAPLTFSKVTDSAVSAESGTDALGPVERLWCRQGAREGRCWNQAGTGEGAGEWGAVPLWLAEPRCSTSGPF